MKTELYALYLAARHPETPWYAKLIVAGFVAYAVTPVDFVPDAIPILGLVDDLIFIPLAVALAIRFVPSPARRMPSARTGAPRRDAEGELARDRGRLGRRDRGGRRLLPVKFAQYRPHPWHGLEAGRELPLWVNAYIEITPYDLIKYEVDKASGYLRVDRPQRTSSQPPSLYGFIPRTYCGERIAALCPGADRGDGDPLDICVISERPIQRSEIIVPARVVGGLQLLDRGEADDKVIAVLEADFVWGALKDVAELPPILVERLQHYFTTYKLVPGTLAQIAVQQVYGAEHAARVVQAALEDYEALRRS